MSLTSCSAVARIFLFALIAIISACSSKPTSSNLPNLAKANIFINQLAFDAQEPKQAVITLPITESARRFIVYQKSSIIYQGKLTAQSTSAELKQEANCYLADFSSVQRKGKFYIVVNTPKQQLTSSTFIIY